MVFYCSTLSAPISRCINVLSTQQREKMCFLTRIINFSHLHHILLKNHSLLGRMHNENTPKYFATKTKTPLLGVKSFFFISTFVHYIIMWGEAEIIEKNGHRMCFHFHEWIIYDYRPSLQLLILFVVALWTTRQKLKLEHFFNTASNSFRKLPSSPWFFSATSLEHIIATAKIMTNRWLFGKEWRNT